MSDEELAKAFSSKWNHFETMAAAHDGYIAGLRAGREEAAKKAFEMLQAISFVRKQESDEYRAVGTLLNQIVGKRVSAQGEPEPTWEQIAAAIRGGGG